MSTIPGQPAGCRVGGQPHPTGGGAQGVAPPVEAATRRRRAGGPLDQPADGSPVVNLVRSGALDHAPAVKVPQELRPGV